MKKLKENNIYIENEILISKIITEIENYKFFFSPIINIVPINLVKININKGKNIKEKDTKNLLLEYNSIEGYSLFEYISIIPENRFIIVIIEIYSSLLNSINILLKNNIIHFNLNSDNIICENITQNPILINFKKSVLIKKLEDNLNFITCIESKYMYIYCLEVQVIYYILFNKINILTREIILIIVNKYINSLKEVIMYDDFDINYLSIIRENCINYLEFYINKNSKIILNDMILTCKTWDNYSISILFLIILFKNKSFTNIFLNNFIELLIKNICPNTRLNIDEMLIQFSTLL
jgi:hypothetical protein